MNEQYNLAHGPTSRPTTGIREQTAATGAAAEPASSLSDSITAALIKHRWAVVVPLLLPASRLYSAGWWLRNVLYREITGTAGLHDARVQDIANQVKRWRARGGSGLLHTSRKSWQSVSVRNLSYKRDTARAIEVDLHGILAIDLQRGVVTVEPRVNIAQLTRRLTPLGVTIPVVPELDELTAGGLFLGYGIESSSHKYGLFADTVLAAELVLSDGRVVRASKRENPELFYSLPWSHGAHGILTALELPLIASKPYVKVSYRPLRSREQLCAELCTIASSTSPPAFVEAIMFEAERGVLVIGQPAELPAGVAPNRISRFYKPWFYKHAEQSAASGRPDEYVPLRDYYHRYSRSVYFHGELLVPFGNHPLFRYLLGWLMPPKVAILRLAQTRRIREFRDARNVVQDVLVPLRLLPEALAMVDREFDCYPTWLCMHKVTKTSPAGMLSVSKPELDSEMFVDIGLWQVPGFVKRGQAWDGHRAVRNMEAWLRAHHGYQCLYAVTEQSEAEFWQMFDRTLYARVRKLFGGEGTFMDVFDKVRRRA